MNRKTPVTSRRCSLVVVLLSLVVNDVEELELVDALGSRNNTEPVTELHLLEELLGPFPKCQRLSYSCNETLISLQVLEIPATELVMRNDLDLAVASLGDLDGVAEVSHAAIDLDLLVQELLEGRDIENLVAGGLRGIDDELQLVSILDRRRIAEMLTFLVVLGPLPFPDFFCKFSDLAYCFTP